MKATAGIASDRLVLIVSEAPTPHNNYLFSALARNSGLSMELNYVFSADRVPGRPWKSLRADIPGMKAVRTGLGSWFDRRLFLQALRNRRTVFFVIGWNHPILYLTILVVGIRRGYLLMWFDTPNPNRKQAAWQPKYWLNKLIVQMINRTSGTIFATGRQARIGLQRLGLGEEKISILPFFVPFQDVELTNGRLAKLREKYQLVGDAVALLAAGRMIQSKGFDIFIDALAELDRSRPEGWVAFLIGSGAESEALVRQAEALGLMHRVRFLPWAEAEEFNELMCVCDVFVAPARFDPFPTTVISAMNLGKPVVATKGVGSAMEFVVDGENGLIVESGRIDALAEALARLLQFPELRMRIGNRAKRSMQRWPVERGVQAIISAVDALSRS
jgi:glycosyltransferase involved in cell wall biosynthesis